MEPIITKTKERQVVVLNGERIEVAESVITDHGEQGVTKVYIGDAVPGSPAALQRFLRTRGYELVDPIKGGKAI